MKADLRIEWNDVGVNQLINTIIIILVFLVITLCIILIVIQKIIKIQILKNNFQSNISLMLKFGVLIKNYKP